MAANVLMTTTTPSAPLDASGGDLTKPGTNTPDPILSDCFLWIAQYNGPNPLNIPPTFRTWTFWQYTDGVHGDEPHTVPGVGQCDRNKFNGTVVQLRKLWGA